MNTYKDFNWILSGIVSSICLLVLLFFFHMNIVIVSLFSLLVFIGGIFLWKPNTLYCQGIDISSVSNRNKYIKNINAWIESMNALKVLSQSVDSAYLQLKAMQIYTISESVFSQLHNNSNGIYPLEKFFLLFLRLSLKLMNQYNEIDILSATKNNQQQKEKIRVKIEQLIEVFNLKIELMMTNDVKEIISFVTLIKEIDGE